MLPFETQKKIENKIPRVLNLGLNISKYTHFTFTLSMGIVNRVNRVFPILILDLAQLDELDNEIDCPWIDKMFIYIIHRTVHYSWTVEM